MCFWTALTWTDTRRVNQSIDLVDSYFRNDLSNILLYLQGAACSSEYT